MKDLRYHLYQSLVFQLVFNTVLDESIYNGKDRYAEYHSRKAEKSGHDGDGYDDPHRIKTDGRTDELGTDIVAVDLLDQQYQEAEPNSIAGTCDEYNESAGDRSYERTEEGNDICDTYNKAYKRIIRHSEYCHTEEADDTDDDGVEDLCRYEAAEALIRYDDILHEGFVLFLAEAGVRYLLCPSAEALFCKKKIYRHNDTDK